MHWMADVLRHYPELAVSRWAVSRCAYRHLVCERRAMFFGRIPEPAIWVFDTVASVPVRRSSAGCATRVRASSSSES